MAFNKNFKGRIGNELLKIRRQIRELRSIKKQRPASCNSPSLNHGADSHIVLNRPLINSLLCNMPAGVVVADKTGKMIFINPMANTILGGEITGTVYRPNGRYSLSYPTGKPYPPEQLPLPVAIDKGISTRDIEILIQFEDGGQKIILAGASPILDNYGQIAGAVAVFQDITKRKLMESELEEHRNRFEELVRIRTDELLKIKTQLQRETLERKRAEESLSISNECFYTAFHASPAVKCIISVESQEIIEVNESFLHHTGYFREEVVGVCWNKLTPLIEQKDLKKITDLLQKHAGFRSLEISYSTKTGETRTGLLSMELINIEGNQCYLSVLNDITYKKQLENEMLRFDQLDIVGELAAGIGHEIRNPMTTARGFLQMLSSKDDCKKYSEYFDLIIDEIDRANTIISEFLSMARNKPVALKRLNLNDTLKQLYPLIKSDATLRDQEVKLELEEIPKLLLNEKEMRQLVLNLARNGMEAMSNGGTLTLKTYIDNDVIVLEVQDTGEGIPAELVSKLGTPFFTTKEKGTGIGLAVCYSIAERHNAKINVCTGPEGTTFLIRFNV